MFDTTLGQYTCTVTGSSIRYQITYSPHQDKKNTKTETKKSQSILYQSLISTINLKTALHLHVSSISDQREVHQKLSVQHKMTEWQITHQSTMQ